MTDSPELPNSHEEDPMFSLANVPRWFLERTQEGRKMITEVLTQVQHERTRLAQEILAADAAREKGLPALNAARERAQSKVEAAEAALKAASQARAIAHGERVGVVSLHDQRINVARAALRASAPPDIDRVVGRIDGLLASLRRDGLALATTFPEGGGLPSMASNMTTVTSALDRLRELQTAAADLVFSASPTLLADLAEIERDAVSVARAVVPIA